jgi:RNA polymerase sigma-70 factor, ECF subfamily
MGAPASRIKSRSHDDGMTVGTRVELRSAILEFQSVTAGRAEASDDAMLVIAARDGDRAAFGRLYDRYARMVHGILLARVPLGDVDDLVHDVFLLALSRIRALRDAARFGAWLAAITRNRAHDYHRQTRAVTQSTEDLPEGEVEVPDRSGPSDAEAAIILSVVRNLPEAYRETMILRLVEGMTGPEIAQRTGLTPGSVRVNLHRGMQQLRAKLGNQKSEVRSQKSGVGSQETE